MTAHVVDLDQLVIVLKELDWAPVAPLLFGIAFPSTACYIARGPVLPSGRTDWSHVVTVTGGAYTTRRGWRPLAPVLHAQAAAGLPPERGAPCRQ